MFLVDNHQDSLSQSSCEVDETHWTADDYPQVVRVLYFCVSYTWPWNAQVASKAINFSWVFCRLSHGTAFWNVHSKPSAF